MTSGGGIAAAQPRTDLLQPLQPRNELKDWVALRLDRECF